MTTTRPVTVRHPAMDPDVNPRAFCRSTGTADCLGTWSDFDVDGGPVLLCVTHREPLEGTAYDTGIGVCVPTRTYIEAHSTVRADAPSRCLCGRNVDRCGDRVEVTAILADLDARTAGYAQWLVELRETTPDTVHAWRVPVFAVDEAEAVAAARWRLVNENGHPEAEAAALTVDGATRITS